MKSLEIVNEIIDNEVIFDGRALWNDEMIINKKDLQQIKQDLEVLTILRKCYKVKYGRITKDEKVIPYIEIYKTSILESLEEFHKLKQWLEENDEKDKV